MSGTWQDFLKGGLSSWLDSGQTTPANTTPAYQTPVYNAPRSTTVPTAQPSTAGLWTTTDTMLAGAAAVLVLVLVMMRK